MNWHITEICNYRCRFCFATFASAPKASRICESDGWRIIDRLKDLGCQKLTFAGGEPLLHEHLFSWVYHAKSVGLTTMLITNGHFWKEDTAERFAGRLDWVGLSVDASTQALQSRLGRGNYDPVERAGRISSQAKTNGIRFKLNTVVTALNYADDMTTVVEVSMPERWKVFQYLVVEGERVDPELFLSQDDFESYVERHRCLEEIGISIVPEDNSDMNGSYRMLDPFGAPYDNRMVTQPNGRALGIRRYYQSFLSDSMAEDFVNMNYSAGKLEARGGIYSW
ncbi:MAG: viperin family antiviral radical SAM protein [Verrucomicrobiota bacterium]